MCGGSVGGRGGGVGARITLFPPVCVLKLGKVLVGGCKSLSSSRMRWVFGERLESLLTGSQIDEVMVMDGGNKGLDVLSVVSDEAGMNHPSGASAHDAAQYQCFPPPSRRPVAVSLLRDFCTNRTKHKHSPAFRQRLRLCPCIF